MSRVSNTLAGGLSKAHFPKDSASRGPGPPHILSDEGPLELPDEGVDGDGPSPLPNIAQNEHHPAPGSTLVVIPGPATSSRMATYESPTSKPCARD